MKRSTSISALTLVLLAIAAAPAAAQAPTPPQDPTQPGPPPVQQRVVISLPERCVRSDFVARISIQPPSPTTGGTRGASSTRVTLDYRRVLRVTAQASFGVRVPARSLRPGLHRIGVSVTSRAGNLEELRGAKRFRRCR